MSAQMLSNPESLPALWRFPVFRRQLPESTASERAAARPDRRRCRRNSEAAIYQTLLAADAMRFSHCRSPAASPSGHPAASPPAPDAVARCSIGPRKWWKSRHHARLLSAMFLVSSWKPWASQVARCARVCRERHGLLGLSPARSRFAGAVAQLAGPDFAWRRLSASRQTVPVTIGDGAWRAYIMSAFSTRHRLSRGHQLSASDGVERLLAGPPQHGVLVGQHAHDPLLARARFDEVHLIDARDFAGTPDAPATRNRHLRLRARMASPAPS